MIFETSQTRGWCDSLSSHTRTLNNINGVDLIYEPIRKINVPDGMGVKLFTDAGKSLLIAGPYTITDLNLCQSWNWNRVQQFRVGEAPSGLDNSVVRDNIVFDPANIKEPLDNETMWIKNVAEERGDQKVVICSAPRLKGLCVQYGSSSTSSDLFTPFESLKQKKCDLGMQSMKIPEGVKVTGVQYVNGERSEFGPYVGPVLVDKIDNSYKYDVQVVNMFKAQPEKKLFDYYNPKPVFPLPFRNKNEPLVSQLKVKPKKEDAQIRSPQLKLKLKTIRD